MRSKRIAPLTSEGCFDILFATIEVNYVNV